MSRVSHVFDVHTLIGGTNMVRLCFLLIIFPGFVVAIHSLLWLRGAVSRGRVVLVGGIVAMYYIHFMYCYCIYSNIYLFLSTLFWALFEFRVERIAERECSGVTKSEINWSRGWRFDFGRTPVKLRITGSDSRLDLSPVEPIA